MDPLDRLFERLRDAPDAQSAAAIERDIWQVWLSAGGAALEARLEQAQEAMAAGEAGRAMRHLDAVTESAPDFAEAFNKRATLHYLVGDFRASTADIARTLEIEPRHFGALSGLALILEAQQRPFEALEALERVIRLYPRFPQLEARIAKLTSALGEAL